MTPIGWRCPNCGVANAPWRAKCDCTDKPETVEPDEEMQVLLGVPTPEKVGPICIHQGVEQTQGLVCAICGLLMRGPIQT